MNGAIVRSENEHMISLPLPHVVALFLAAMLVVMARNGELFKRENLLFVILLVAYTVQSLLIGFRWGYGMLAILPYQAVMATLIASLAWISFSTLARERTELWPSDIWPHLVPAAMTAGFLAFCPDVVGPFIILVFFVYGTALLVLARHGADGLVASRLDGAFRSCLAMRFTGIALIASSFSDIAISLDLELSGGSHTGTVIAAGNVIALLVLGLAALGASGATVDEEIQPDNAQNQKPTGPSDTDAEIAAAVERLMQDTELYRDMELNLSRLSRRLRIPARAVSSAINRIHGESVSQYVNNYRVRAACKMLEETDSTVISIIYGAGFMTKSNFNREFLRVTGTTPSNWRRQHAAKASGDQQQAAG
jgi:AraC-like DNA-binding protein